eukprot:SAG22_NODE_3550_length_1649_cov_3.387742_3_plen_190_part_00
MSDEEYGRYIARTVRPGMKLRLLRPFEVVQQGDTGRFLATNGGMPPCQVQWDRLGSAFWVHWRDVEIIDTPPPPKPQRRRQTQPQSTAAAAAMAADDDDEYADQLPAGGLRQTTNADQFFLDHIIEFRRVRQLAEPAAEVGAASLGGKFCGQFCAGGAEAERRLVRRELLPRWCDQLEYQIRPAVEALW